MVRYLGAAVALKIFSLSGQTRRIYRFLGNTFGARRRSRAGLPTVRINRAKWILGLFEKYNISQEGARLVELGTGWVHWESTILRLFYNAKFTLFDVWDNRQFRVFKIFVTDFAGIFDEEIKNLPTTHDKARGLLEKILSVNSFAELYGLLGFQYVIEPTGRLLSLERGAYDACFSYDVLEHVDEKIVSEYIEDLYHILKPGGYSFHVIDMSDHLTYYDKSVDRKNYMRYSDPIWRFFFENEMQYFNRIQRGQWLSLFSRAGFELLEENSTSKPIGKRVNKKYSDLGETDIECMTLKIVHRKPSETALRAADRPL